MNEAPIGIFDSGIGGLTVASSISKAFPNESILYFGDTAHLPYGEKSVQSIQKYGDYFFLQRENENRYNYYFDYTERQVRLALKH